jgi:hypothetical protein
VGNSQGFEIDRTGRTARLFSDNFDTVFYYDGEARLPSMVKSIVKKPTEDDGWAGEQKIHFVDEAIFLDYLSERLDMAYSADCHSFKMNSTPGCGVVKSAGNISGKLRRDVQLKNIDSRPFLRAIKGFCQLASVKESAFKPFCEALAKPQSVVPPESITITLSGRTYELLSFFKGNEKSGDVMVAHAEKMNANLGEEDAEWFLKHQAEIPVALRQGVIIVFTGWREPGGPGRVARVDWNGGRWVQSWCWLGWNWDSKSRLPRRK